MKTQSETRNELDEMAPGEFFRLFFLSSPVESFITFSYFRRSRWLSKNLLSLKIQMKPFSRWFNLNPGSP